MNKAFEKIIEKLEETDFNDIQMVVREVLLKYGFPYESVVQDEVWDALDELSTNKFAKKIVQEVAEEYKDGWISVSERLPEDGGYYLVTYHEWSDGNFLPKYDYTYVRRLHYQISEHFVGWNYPKNVDDRAENDCHKEVIAWQPLPEVYKN